MSYEHLNSSDGVDPPGDGSQEVRPSHIPVRPSETECTGPVTDREVPLPSVQATPLVHAWLDGDVTTAMIRATAGGNEAVELWTRINGEAELLRSRTTPLYVHKRIMDSLPDDMYRQSERWYHRSVQLRPVTLIVTAAALLGIGALLARIAAR